MGSPAQFPQNDFTDLISRIAESNAAGGGRGTSVSAGVPSSVKSAAIGRIIPPQPLSDEENAELNSKARALGLLPNDGEEEMSLEEAIALGAPVERPAQAASTRQPNEFLTGSSFVDGGALGPFSRLPDFSRIQGFDLQRGLIHVDGLDFEIPPKDIIGFKTYAMKIVKVKLLSDLESAMKTYRNNAESIREEISGATANVLQVQDGDKTGSVQPVSTESVSGTEGGSVVPVVRRKYKKRRAKAKEKSSTPSKPIEEQLRDSGD